MMGELGLDEAVYKGILGEIGAVSGNEVQGRFEGGAGLETLCFDMLEIMIISDVNKGPYSDSETTGTGFTTVRRQDTTCVNCGKANAGTGRPLVGKNAISRNARRRRTV